MSTSDDYNRLIGDDRNPLVKGMDAAIEEINSEPYTVEQRHADEENAERWLAIGQAEQIVGKWGVVLPTATAKQILNMLRGGGDSGAFTADLLAKMLQAAIEKSEA